MTGVKPVRLDCSLGYSVWVGDDLLERAGELIPLPAGAERIALVTDPQVRALHGERALLGLRATNLPVVEFTASEGEAAKTMEQAEALARGFASAGMHRRDLVVALGGGAVSDLAGFVAATYHRGIAFASVPTTLLGQVDASIGGKTGVNLPEGKNLMGAFHQPVAVLADVSTLGTLPDAEFRSGLAEVAKHGFIGDPELLDALSAGTDGLERRDAATLVRIVARAAAVKVKVVGEDETEQGVRASLNYGHTVGHALEALGLAGRGARLRHGEAVSIGMVVAAIVGAKLGFEDTIEQHRRVLAALGLPISGAGVPFDEVLAAMQADKKYLGGVRFVVLERLGRTRLVGDVGEEILRAAYEEVL